MRHFLSDLSWGEEASMLKQVQSIYSNIRMEMVIITQYSLSYQIIAMKDMG